MVELKTQALKDTFSIIFGDILDSTWHGLAFKVSSSTQTGVTVHPFRSRITELETPVHLSV